MCRWTQSEANGYYQEWIWEEKLIDRTKIKRDETMKNGQLNSENYQFKQGCFVCNQRTKKKDMRNGRHKNKYKFWDRREYLRTDN